MGTNIVDVNNVDTNRVAKAAWAAAWRSGYANRFGMGQGKVMIPDSLRNTPLLRSNGQAAGDGPVSREVGGVVHTRLAPRDSYTKPQGGDQARNLPPTFAVVPGTTGDGRSAVVEPDRGADQVLVDCFNLNDAERYRVPWGESIRHAAPKMANDLAGETSQANSAAVLAAAAATAQPSLQAAPMFQQPFQPQVPGVDPHLVAAVVAALQRGPAVLPQALPVQYPAAPGQSPLPFAVAPPPAVDVQTAMGLPTGLVASEPPHAVEVDLGQGGRILAYYHDVQFLSGSDDGHLPRVQLTFDTRWKGGRVDLPLRGPGDPPFTLSVAGQSPVLVINPGLVVTLGCYRVCTLPVAG